MYTEFFTPSAEALSRAYAQGHHAGLVLGLLVGLVAVVVVGLVAYSAGRRESS